MKKAISLFAVALLAAAFSASAALACDTCGCSAGADKASAACACGSDGECACGDHAAATKAGCPHAHAASYGDESLPDWHAKSPAGLSVSLQQLEAFDVAYLTGTFGSDMDALYGELMAAAGEQGLLGEDTHVGAFLNGVQYSEPTDETQINIAIWNTDSSKAAAPIRSYTIPGGYYMVVQHQGDYDQIGETYLQAIGWAEESGIEFAGGPSFLHHVNDPESAPVEQWLTEIYLPFDHSTTASADAGSEDLVG